MAVIVRCPGPAAPGRGHAGQPIGPPRPDRSGGHAQQLARVDLVRVAQHGAVASKIFM